VQWSDDRIRLWSWVFGCAFDAARGSCAGCRPVGYRDPVGGPVRSPALLSDVFQPLPGMGCWQKVLLIDGNVGLGGDPRRILGPAAGLLGHGGRCAAEFDAEAIGIRASWIRLESARQVGPWFRWAWVGLDSAAMLAREVGLRMTRVQLIGERVVANMAVL
jgi:hypothetical protein